jgi:hypothetical protein
MKPFLSYGWQPQIMAVEGRQKAIFAGRNEVYDVIADPAEARDLAGEAQLSSGPAAGAGRVPGPVDRGRRGAAALDDGQRQLASARLRQRHRTAGGPQGRAAPG